MFSLIRKISNSQHPKDNTDQPTNTDDVGAKHEDNQKEEVDGTTYDPHADPRDPGRYYTFPHFAEDKQETDAPQQSPGTPDKDEQAAHREPGYFDQDSSSTSNHKTTPVPKSTSPSSSETDQISPPFWPTSPLSKRLRSKPSTPNASCPRQRRSTTSSPCSPQVLRVQPCRRVTGNSDTQSKSPSNKYHSSPAARSLRSISAAQSPTRKSDRQQQHRRVSDHIQGSLKMNEEKSG